MNKNWFKTTLLFLFYIKLLFSDLFFTRQMNSKLNMTSYVRFINKSNNFIKKKILNPNNKLINTIFMNKNWFIMTLLFLLYT